MPTSQRAFSDLGSLPPESLCRLAMSDRLITGYHAGPDRVVLFFDAEHQSFAPEQAVIFLSALLRTRPWFASMQD